MSPVSRKRQKKHRPNPSSNRPQPASRAEPAGRTALDAVYGDLEDALQETLRSEDPFVAEILLTDVLGSMRGIEADEPGAPTGTVDAFIDGLAVRANPAATAALVALARLAPAESSRMRARHRLRELPGIFRPAWTGAIDTWAPDRAMVLADAFGDTATVAVEFTGTGRTHALLAHVDFSHLGGWCPEVFVIEDTAAVRAAMGRDGAADPVHHYVELDLAAARFLLERALAATERTEAPATAEAFDEMHALALARLRLLPATSDPTAAASVEVRAALVAAGLHAPSALDDRVIAEPSAREALVRQFTESEPASAPVGLAPDSVALLARELVDYGFDYDDGRPLRLSPLKLATFLARWLPSRVTLTAADRTTLPAVVTAWVDFALAGSPLPAAADADLRAALPGLLAAVTAAD
ncbi:hypothetical protein [Pengzhenrongella frigida]|uniref:Uncharacterized protein n=1 Tax=Pengzhenrongella frigida TaxID=1259133 RepID=A0A4Q5N0C2_9MICO|nr:hypothetical protein [Cellulomonas sp. HLT2-17]RYV51470.1 hypothetical protein EUA98_08575 [Cellulomonas sp. HLT2-17]